MEVGKWMYVCGGLMVMAGTAVPQARAYQTVVEIGIDRASPATGAGQLVFAVREPDIGCTGALLFQHTQPYDAVPGGDPTTAEEIGGALLVGLSDAALLKWIFKKTNRGWGATFWRPCSVGGQPEFFDVCVEGNEIAGNEGLGSYAENGITVTGTMIELNPTCIPTVSSWGLLLLALLILTGVKLGSARRPDGKSDHVFKKC